MSATVTVDKELLIAMLEECFREEVAHLRLRIIRDTQAPRFEALKESHPEIYKDFMAARTGPHEILLAVRTARIKLLKELIEESK